MNKQTEALKLALEALENPYLGPMPERTRKAITAIREALAEDFSGTEQPKLSDYEPDGMHHNKPQKRPQNCGTGYCSCIECLFEQPAQQEQEPFGYFKPEPFGWTDCAETDEGAIALYERPQPAQQQKEGFASPGGGYVPAIPRPMPPDWKLVPRKATPEMLKAMDECAQEGYDERLYAGMASSVYMAAWDASPVMGTLPEQPAQQQEPLDKNGSPCAEFWDWLPKAYNFEGAGNFTKYNMEVAFLAGKQSASAQEPVEYWTVADGWVSEQAEVPAFVWVEPDFWEHCKRVNCGTAYRLPAPGRQPLYTSPPASKPLTDEQITAGAQALCQQMAEACNVDAGDQWQLYADIFKEDAKAVLTAAAKLREKNA